MRTVAAVKAHLLQYFKRNCMKWLSQMPSMEGFPLIISLRAPTGTEAIANQDSARKWISEWQNLPTNLGAVRWEELRWRYLGKQMIPKALELPDPNTLARWIGLEPAWKKALKRSQKSLELFPELVGGLSRMYFEYFEMEDSDFERLLEVLSWIKNNRGVSLYPRELPIVGVDSKWVENHEKYLATAASELFGETIRSHNLYSSLGFKTPPKNLIHLRPLCSNLKKIMGGWDYFRVELCDLIKLKIKPRLVIIVENLQTGLSFKSLPGTLLFMAKGYSATEFAQIPFLKDTPCLYWGDIDTHGFKIINLVRKELPHLKSMLMDETTFLSHCKFWVSEENPVKNSELSYLTAPELELFEKIRFGKWGQNLRLEQEKVYWPMAWQIIEKEAALY
jgi:hypothetical protein